MWILTENDEGCLQLLKKRERETGIKWRNQASKKGGK